MSNSNASQKLLDIVVLVADLPEYNLLHGQVGTIVELLDNGAAFEVEFSDSAGRVQVSVGLLPEQFVVAHPFK